VYCAFAEHNVAPPAPLEAYLNGSAKLPTDDSGRWFVLNWIREELSRRYAEGDLAELGVMTAGQVNQFLLGLPEEHRFALLVDAVPAWSQLGADESLLQSLVDVTGI
jgi:hypothetical protein